jgi:hypothetical protein
MNSFLINTPLQRGVRRTGRTKNRFNGLDVVWETVETVCRNSVSFYTPLKQCVNESFPPSARPARWFYTSLKRGVNERALRSARYAVKHPGLESVSNVR